MPDRIGTGSIPQKTAPAHTDRRVSSSRTRDICPPRRRPCIYLDHAATSYPKPPAVLRAVSDCITCSGGNPGHGSHALALAAAREVYRCRESAAALFGSAHPEHVIFTLNTPHALNLALKGLLRPGDHAICSDMEHNAVYRPLEKLAHDGFSGKGTITYDVFDTFPASVARSEGLILASLSSHLKPETRLVVVAHESNLCPAVMPLAAIGRLCRERGILFVVDAAQSAGTLDIDMERMHIDALCVPGHKGLLGPMGSGMLLLGDRVTPDTLLEGGNGIDSLSGEMSSDLPERYESGTLPLPAIAGLRAGIDFVRDMTPDALHERETALAGRAKAGLAELPGVHLIAPHLEGATCLFTVDGFDSDEVSAMLDGAAGDDTPFALPSWEAHTDGRIRPRHGTPGICVRPGFHCTALGHRTLGTPAGGAVRVSFGWNNTERDAEALIRAMRRITRPEHHV